MYGSVIISTFYLHLNKIKLSNASVNQGSHRGAQQGKDIKAKPKPFFTQPTIIITCAKQIFSLQP